MKDVQCAWVSHNRSEPGRRPRPPVETARTEARSQWEKARRGQAVAVGDLVESLLESRTRLSAVQVRLLEVLDDGAGGDLVSHITAVRLTRGVLRVETSEPAVLYDLRLRWQEKILRLVQRSLPDLKVDKVRFALARGQGKPPVGR